MTSVFTFPEAVLCGAAGERTPLADTLDHLSRTGEFKFDPNSPENLRKQAEAEAAIQREIDEMMAAANENLADADARNTNRMIDAWKKKRRRLDDERGQKLGVPLDKLIQAYTGCPTATPDPDKRSPEQEERVKSLRQQGAKDPEEVERLESQLRGRR